MTTSFVLPDRTQRSHTTTSPGWNSLSSFAGSGLRRARQRTGPREIGEAVPFVTKRLAGGAGTGSRG